MFTMCAQGGFLWLVFWHMFSLENSNDWAEIRQIPALREFIIVQIFIIE
jgi:hypothetical protein